MVIPIYASHTRGVIVRERLTAAQRSIMKQPFAASGVITITTDFGHQGPFVATMKGRILSRLPDARIIDVTHEVPVYWPAEAGFWLSRSYEYFPTGTVHIAVVDPGVG